MHALLKQRYSLVDVVLATVLLGAALCFLFTRDRGTRYASHFDPQCADSAKSPRRMQDAFAQIVARRNVKMPLEKQKEIAKLSFSTIWTSGRICGTWACASRRIPAICG